MASSATVVIVAELKKPRASFAETGLSLFTSTYRCSTPDVFDLRLNSHSRLNLIQALIQAIAAGADEALMLDQRGMVASCNSTNFFIIRKGELWTSPGLYSFNGITRQHVFDLWGEKIGAAHMKDFPLAQTYSADEAFVTGTLGGITFRERFKHEHSSLALYPHNVSRGLVIDATPALVKHNAHVAVDELAD